jgi:hypothetical protein
MTTMHADRRAKRSKKPFILWCLGGACLAVVLVIIGFTWYWVSWVKSVPEDAPTVNPKPFDQQAFDDFGRRYEAFRSAVERGGDEELILTEDDVNLCLAKWAKEEPDAARAIVLLEGSTAKGQASIPITKENGDKKWVNCEFAVGVSVNDGELDVQIREIHVKEKTFDEKGIFAKPIDQLISDALANLHKDPNANRQLDKVQSLEIKGGKIHVKAKPGTKLDRIKTGN